MADNNFIDGHLLTFKASIEDETIQIILDTGSAVNVISSKLAQKIQASLCIGDTPQIRTVDGKMFRPTCKVQFPLKLKTRTVQIQAYVVEGFFHDLLLGKVFCEINNVIINFPEAKMTIAEDVYNIPVKTHRECFGAKNVCLLEDVIIPARSEVLIPAFIDREGVNLVEGLPSETRQTDLMVATVLVTVKGGKTGIRIANPTFQNITLKARSTIGKALSLYELTLGLSCYTYQRDRYPKSDVGIREGINQESNYSPHESYDFNEYTKSYSETPNWEQVKLGDDLTLEETSQLQDLLYEYRDLFSTQATHVGRTPLISHRIPTADHEPISLRPYRQSIAQKEIIRQQVDNLLRDGLISESDSEWNFPLVLVKKPGINNWRLCVDYRQLNAITQKSVFPLPRVDELLDQANNAQYYSSIDVLSGYWHIEVHPDDRPKTAFSAAGNHFSWNRMPFGLCGAPNTFQRLINSVLRGLMHKICLAYLDDILILSRTFEDHLLHLQQVFDRLREADLRIKPSKCVLAKSSIKYLGFEISRKGIWPNQDKVQAILALRSPRTKKQVRSILGIFMYYRKHIKGFAKIAKAMTNLTRAKVTFEWTQECQEALETLKDTLMNAPILRHFNPELVTEIHCDASHSGISGILTQKDNNEELPMQTTTNADTLSRFPRQDWVEPPEDEAEGRLGGISILMTTEQMVEKSVLEKEQKRMRQLHVKMKKD